MVTVGRTYRGRESKRKSGQGDEAKSDRQKENESQEDHMRTASSAASASSSASAPSTPRKRKSVISPLTPRAQIIASPYHGNVNSPSPSKKAVDLAHVFSDALSRSGGRSPSTNDDDGTGKSRARLLERMTSSPRSQRTVDSMSTLLSKEEITKAEDEDEAQASPRDIFASVAPIKPENSQSSSRTYGGVRTFLAGDCSFNGQGTNEAHTTEGSIPQHKTSYRQLAAQLNDSMSSKDCFALEQDDPEDENVHNLAILRENGDLRKFQDDLEYLLEGVDSPDLSPDKKREIWLEQTEEIMGKLKQPTFIRLLKLSGSSQKLLEALIPPDDTGLADLCNGRYVEILNIVQRSEPSAIPLWLRADQTLQDGRRPAQLLRTTLLTDADHVAESIYYCSADTSLEVDEKARRHIGLASFVLEQLARDDPGFLPEYFALAQRMIYYIVDVQVTADLVESTLSKAAEPFYVFLVELSWAQGHHVSIWDRYSSLLEKIRESNMDGKITTLEIPQALLVGLLRLSALDHGVMDDCQAYECQRTFNETGLLAQTLTMVHPHPQYLETCFAVMSNLVEVLASQGKLKIPIDEFRSLALMWYRLEREAISHLEGGEREIYWSCRSTLAVLLANVAVSSEESFYQLSNKRLNWQQVITILEEHSSRKDDHDGGDLSAELKAAEKVLGSHLLLEQLREKVQNHQE